MGSWDVVCSLSGVNIGVGDPCVLIPLKMRDDVYDLETSAMRQFGTSSLLCNEGANVYFKEAMFPIYGVYDDYGRMGDVVRDTNVEVIEEYFGLTIGQILSVLHDNRKTQYGEMVDKKLSFKEDGLGLSDSKAILDLDNDRHRELFTYSITWIHKDVFDRLAETPHGEDYDDVYPGNVLMLQELGFEDKGIDKKRERYNHKFKQGKVAVYTDGTYIENGGYDFNQFKEFCSKQGLEIDISKFEKMRKYEQIYRYQLIPGEGLDGMLHWYLPLAPRYLGGLFSIPEIDKWQEMAEAKDEKLLAMIKREKEIQKKIQGMWQLYWKRMKDDPESLVNNFTDWHTVKHYFYVMGRILFPIGMSPQWGEPDTVQYVLDAASEVNKAQLRQIEDDE